jgi:hypothetical protein
MDWILFYFFVNFTTPVKQKPKNGLIPMEWDKKIPLDRLGRQTHTE